MNKSFVHLHNHSEYSLLDGVSRTSAMVARAKSQGSPAIALTDHGVMFGAMEFYTEAKKIGITPIIGVEAYMAPLGHLDRSQRNEAHVTLLAMNNTGYHNLCRLVTLGFTEGYYYKPRIDMDLLRQYNEGIILLSGCLSGLVQEPLKTGNYELAKANAQAYKDIFGDRFYLEIMRHGLEDQKDVEKYMFRLRDELHVPLVATNDSHYCDHQDHEYHDVMCCLQTGKTLSDPNRFKLPGTPEFYLKSPEDMRKIFSDISEACDATLEIASRIDIDLHTDKFHIPEYPVPEEKKTKSGVSMTPVQYLRSLCLGGIRKRYPTTHQNPEIQERMNYELGVIERMGFSSYFLIVWDFIKYARDHDIPVGPGRGSAVGSIVSYCLGITGMDPLRFGLYFERFLNPSRISMPDIDTDFCIEGREEVIRYVTEKYGSDRVSGIVTFGTLASRNAIRDSGRVLDIPLPIVDKLAKMMPSGPTAPNINGARKQIPEINAFARQNIGVVKLLDTAEKIEGLVRNTGTHACAIVIADAPLTDYLPLVTIKKTGSTETSLNTQYEMNWVEKIGLLKMDFLGLRNLTVMRATEREIQKNIDKNFVLADIPDDDAKTYAMIARGDTSGMFQLESDGMRHMLMEMRPDRLDDIVAAVALYRPGPMEFIPRYVGGKHGRIEPNYLHPKLEPILESTYGIAIYQEQVMQIARDVAGYTMAEADELRKVMGKKIHEKVKEQRAKFVSGSVTQGVSKDIAERIFDFIEPFAGYGFNKSHAVAYGWISYQTAYLKTNYPLQYFCALLSSVGDKTDKLVEYINDAQRMKIAVLPPHINTSNVNFSVDGKDIRFGFSAIKGITAASVEAIINDRDKNGKFIDVFDLVSRTRQHGLQRKTLDVLIKVGACDDLPGSRTAQLASLDQAFNIANREVQDKISGQISMFSSQTLPQSTLPPIVEAPPATLLEWEHEGLGIYLSGHPIDEALPLLKKRQACSIVSLKKAPENRHLVTGGLVQSVRHFLTKNGQSMLSGVIEDRTGSIEFVAYPRQYEAVSQHIQTGSIVLFTGSVKEREHFQKNAEEETDESVATERTLILSGAEILVKSQRV